VTYLLPTYLPAQNPKRKKEKKNLNTKRKLQTLFPNGSWQVFVIDLHRVVVVLVLHYDVLVLDLVLRIILTVVIILVLVEIRICVEIDDAELPLSFGYYRW
jgi:hypothetical protein